MQCEWMFDVISDLAEFASSNGLDELSELFEATNDDARKILEDERLNTSKSRALFVVSSSGT